MCELQSCHWELHLFMQCLQLSTWVVFYHSFYDLIRCCHLVKMLTNVINDSGYIWQKSWKINVGLSFWLSVVLKITDCFLIQCFQFYFVIYDFFFACDIKSNWHGTLRTIFKWHVALKVYVPRVSNARFHVLPINLNPQVEGIIFHILHFYLRSNSFTFTHGLFSV